MTTFNGKAKQRRKACRKISSPHLSNNELSGKKISEEKIVRRTFKLRRIHSILLSLLMNFFRLLYFMILYWYYWQWLIICGGLRWNVETGEKKIHFHSLADFLYLEIFANENFSFKTKKFHERSSFKWNNCFCLFALFWETW